MRKFRLLQPVSDAVLLIVGDGAGKIVINTKELGIQQIGKYWLIATLIGNCMPMVESTIAEEEA
ncbi:MAG: hypothetical protein ABSC47_07335 [Terracidiphilus sp.]|jgi:hypothetical protein